MNDEALDERCRALEPIPTDTMDARGGHAGLRELVEAILRPRGDGGAAAAFRASLPG
jgi:hypothetical protein